jgi:DNA-binding NtrC family response regulator
MARSLYGFFSTTSVREERLRLGHKAPLIARTTMPLRILLVEDNADLRREVGEYLARRLHEVEAVASVAEARGLLARDADGIEEIDLVLCDVNLQDGDGIELLAELGPRRPNCPWLLMSGDPDPRRLIETRRQIPHLPPCTIIAKPVSLRKLAAFIASTSQFQS